MWIRLTDLNILVDIPSKIKISKQLEPFQMDGNINNSYCGFKVSHQFLSNSVKLPVSVQSVSYQGQIRYSKDGDRFIFYPSREDPNRSDFLVRIRNSGLEIYTTKKALKELEDPHVFLRRLSAETVFLLNNRLILHSSLIEVNGETILFSGPSQTGKSTQANLWYQFKNAKILNGDRSGLLVENGKPVRAYGLPFAGTSEIYVNEGYPVRAIVLLRQGTDNSIRKVSKLEGLKFLLPEASIPRVDEELTQKGISLLSEILNRVEVFELNATPDKRAVDAVYNYLYRGLEEQK